VAPFSAPFGGLCPRLRSLCKGGTGGCCSPVSGRAWPFDIRTARLGDTTEGVATSRPVSVPADDADASASSAPLCAAQAHPARRSEHETAGLVRRPAVSPVSPEGDHFPQTPVAKAHVLPAPQAPTPPRCHAWQCIRGRDGESVGMVCEGGENGDENGRRSALWTDTDAAEPGPRDGDGSVFKRRLGIYHIICRRSGRRLGAWYSE
jgi:hypothetical protein